MFNGAIQQSGSAVNTWAISYNPREFAFKLGDKLDIETNDSAELVSKLAEFSPKELIAASDEIMKTEVCNFLIAFIKHYVALTKYKLDFLLRISIREVALH